MSDNHDNTDAKNTVQDYDNPIPGSSSTPDNLLNHFPVEEKKTSIAKGLGEMVCFLFI